MIRYPATLAQIESSVDALSPQWRTRAAAKTKTFRKNKKYEEASSSWSEIKQVFMDLQFNKCGYCERLLGIGDKSSIEFDLEHFRPKSSVAAWPKQTSTYNFPTGPASANGYYLLAYNLFNYLVACKKCNSPYKSSYFPIAASQRKISSDDFAVLATENPLLIYPIGELDDNPEDLITFDGTQPRPTTSRGHKFRRARVTIDFFALNTREELLRRRADLIRAIFVAFEDRNHRTSARRRDARLALAEIESNAFEHRNCARAFLKICEENHDLAEAYYTAALDYIESILNR